MRPVACLSMLASSVLALSLVACGGDDNGGNGGDDCEVDPAGTHTQYVMSEVSVPATAGQATGVALDIDGDGRPDNALGGLLGSLTTTADLDIQGPVDDQVAEGGIIILASVKATDLTTSSGTGMWVLFGENPMPAAPDHLSGSASFDVDSTTDINSLCGQIANGALTVGPGLASLEIAFSEGGDTLRLDLQEARVTANVTASGMTAGKLGGAIKSTDIDNEVMPAVQELIAELIDQDCNPANTPCCTEGSAGASVVSFFDEDDDCSVSLDELMTDSLIDSTLRNPDLDLFAADGSPGQDGVKDSLSIGVGFGATGATFDLPAGVN